MSAPARRRANELDQLRKKKPGATKNTALEVVDPQAVTRAEAALMLRWHVSAVRRAENTRFRVVARTPQVLLHRGDVEAVALAQPCSRAEKAARAYDLFAREVTRAEVVRRLRLDPTEVARLHATWIADRGPGLWLSPLDLRRLDALGFGGALGDGTDLANAIARRLTA